MYVFSTGNNLVSVDKVKVDEKRIFFESSYNKKKKIDFSELCKGFWTSNYKSKTYYDIASR